MAHSTSTAEEEQASKKLEGDCYSFIIIHAYYSEHNSSNVEGRGWRTKLVAYHPSIDSVCHLSLDTVCSSAHGADTKSSYIALYVM